jgi:hypothetical protein
MQRLFHVAFLAIIGISLLVQTVRYGISLSGASAPALPLLEQAGLFVFFGGVIAFFKFILGVLRSWRQPTAAIAALGYLVVLIWPLLLSGLDAWVAIRGQASVNNVSLHQPNARVPSPEPAANEQFLAGQAWARENRPVQRADCSGSAEFVRGCFIHILKAREQEEAAGYRWASENRPQRGSDCPAKAPHEQLGCRKWYHEQPNAPREWPYGATTAECRHEVNTNAELQIQLFRLSGNEHGASVFHRRSWEPDLRQCEQIDRRVHNAFMPKAYDRLNAMIEKMKAGGAVTAEDNATFSSDFTEMARIPDQPYKEAYQKLATEFLDRQSGSYKEHKPQYPRISCEEYAAQIEKMRGLEAQRVAELQGLRRPDGVVQNGARAAEINKLRLDMLWDWKFFNDGAKAAGCDVSRQ